MTFLTEYEFTLPKGYVDGEGNVHKNGIMRLATSADEILPARDMRVQTNPSFITLVILSRVITKLGSLSSEKGQINPEVIGSIFVSDFKFLVAFYEKINSNGNLKVPATCPKCANNFEVDFGNLQ
jgi:hypothetical protein